MKKLSLILIITLLSQTLFCSNIYLSNYKVLETVQTTQLQNSNDSIKNMLTKNKIRIAKLDSELNRYKIANNKNLIQVSVQKSIWDTLINFFIIIISVVTLIYVIKADRINNSFGSYRGKKRYEALQKEIADLNIELQDIKNMFDGLTTATPESFIKDGKPEIERLERLINVFEGSKYFRYPGDIKDDRKPLIYGIQDYYYFNNYAVSRIGQCHDIISKIESKINDKINETKDIRFGEDNSSDR